MTTSSSSGPSPAVPRIAATAILTFCLAACAAAAKEAERIGEILCLQPGTRVADVGAGDGDWTVKLAGQVGETGHVWATEIDDDLVGKIRRRVEKAELSNVTVVLGGQEATGLPEGCCDAILLRMVYHHFTDPAPMRADLKKALRPGGIIAVIDIEPQKRWSQLPGVPDRGGHGISVEALVEDMTSDGFKVLSRHREWNGDDDRYCVVFRR